ncbi:MAG: threonylcarbamoyl-AMP synthase [Clostridiales bacterium]|nr:threonylcarbamoyl-AMP synthase [Clostridiales bacterium]
MKTIAAGNSEKEILQAADILRAGGLVVFPTETVYGLGANALDDSAAAKIYAAKGRPSDNPLIVHLADPSQAADYCYPTPLFDRLAERFMPGPLTVILPKKACIPDTVTGGLATVGIRVPSHPTARALLRACQLPIAAPSANLSTKPSPTKAEHAVRDLFGRVDMILDGGPCGIGLESTIVKITGEDSMTLLRPGGITYDQLCEICRNVTVDKAVYTKLGENEKAEAPGMKYRHYAPSAQVIVVDGPHEAVVRYIKQKSSDQFCGVICFEEDKACFSEPVFSLGSRSSTEQQAQRLFDCLRAIDEQKEIERVYAFMPETTGLGLAVMNRLVKAAGFLIEHVKEEM